MKEEKVRMGIAEHIYRFRKNGCTHLLYFTKIAPDGSGGFRGEVYEFFPTPRIIKEFKNTNQEVLLEVIKEALIEKNKEMVLESHDSISTPHGSSKCYVRHSSEDMDEEGILPREYFNYLVVSYRTDSNACASIIYPIAATSGRPIIEKEHQEGIPREVMKKISERLKERHAGLDQTIENIK
jgi:hypothetical protein